MSGPRASRRSFLLGSAAALLGTTAFGASRAFAQDIGPLQAAEPRGITVTARSVDSFQPADRGRVHFGPLAFRGGLSLSSSFPGFGGLSGVRLSPDGEHFIIISDRADWFTGRIVYQGTKPVALSEVIAAPMLGEDGRTLRARRWFDTEALAVDRGTLYVGVERANQIVKFDFRSDGVKARGQPLVLPPFFRTLPFNRGIEALVVVPQGLPLAGTLIALAERALDRSGHLQGYLLLGPKQGAFSIRRSDNYDISDAAILPDGDLLLIERKFSLTGGGIGIRIRRVDGTRIAPGATLDAALMMEADLGHEIDNFEAIDVHRTQAGETVITLVSDDNFSFVQRTLLMQFTLLD